MLGASLLLGGLKYHLQEFNRANARLQSSLLFLASVALLLPSLIGDDGSAPAGYVEALSLALAVLLMATYCLGLLFSLKTHKELFASDTTEETEEPHWPLSVALVILASVTCAVALVSEIFVESVQSAAQNFGMTRIRRLRRRGAGRRGCRDGVRLFRSP